jgi:hypothetical protein
MAAEKSQFHIWLNKRRIFRWVFLRENRDPRVVKSMLDDLREFCRADSSCSTFDRNGTYDTHASAILEGRREVWLRITSILNLSDEALNRMKELENE